jgi:hypothetical protein
VKVADSGPEAPDAVFDDFRELRRLLERIADGAR